MRIAAHLHFAAPWRMAGSETMLHTMMKALTEAGHETLVVTSDMPEAPDSWVHDGVQGKSRRGIAAATAQVQAWRPDVVVTHHQNTSAGIQAARRIGAKSVFVQHNTFGMNAQFLAARPDLTVFNTEWMARQWQHKAQAWMVIHPPIWAAEHATTPGDMVTLINLNRHKGVDVWSRLARHFPNQKFLGVHGGHGEQITWGHPDNCEIIGQTTDMRRDVWSRTRVLLVPSAYESYGMVSVEALASGIPVIAAPTPGLQEALGHAGIFAPRDAVATWVVRLRELLDSPERWQAASARSLVRSRELDPTTELQAWVRVVEDLQAGRMGGVA